jgi:hypothetical protein
LGYKKHHWVQHGNNEFANIKAHINEIENFWGIAKMRLAKFRGLSKSTFYLHLKECEFRFNHRGQNLYKLLLKLSKNSFLTSHEPYFKGSGKASANLSMEPFGKGIFAARAF